jgi:peptide/nickel transport system permease protein
MAETYSATLRGIFTAAFGRSLATGQPVGLLLRDSLVSTGPTLGLAVLLALTLGAAVGVGASLHRSGAMALTIGSVLACLPIVVLAYVVLDGLSAVPRIASYGVCLFMAAVLLALYPTYLTAKTTRGLLTDLMASEQSRFLQACGFSERRALLGLAPKPLMLKLLALVYPTLLYGLSFAFFVEAPLGIPGFGQRFLTAIQTLDYPVIIAFSVVGFVALTLVELTLCLVQAVADPRLRHD